MSVITIEIDYARDVYPYTDETDLYELVDSAVSEAVDSSLIYTADIIDTWVHYGCPEPFDLGMSDSVSGSITNAVYETLIEEHRTIEGWRDVCDEYVSVLLDQLYFIDASEWDDTHYTRSELIDELDNIALLDEQEGHELLLRARDLIRANS